MLSFVEKYGHNVHSQNGEDGIIEECLRRLSISWGRCVEVGANDGLWLSNTRALLERGWAGTFVEADRGLYELCVENWKHNPSVSVSHALVGPDNINQFVTGDTDVFSTDTDGPDYQIFKALEARPLIVIIEIDSSIPSDRMEFNADGGAGYLPMTLLGMEKEYFLLCHTGNLIFVDWQYKEMFPEIEGNGLNNADLYFNRSWLHARVGAT